MNIFELKDGRTVKIDFADIKSIMTVDKADWVEIKEQLDCGLKYVCSKLSGAEVFDLLRPQGPGTVDFSPKEKKEEFKCRAKSLGKVNIPDGEYYALWGGYIVNVKMPLFEKIDIRVDRGVRGIDLECTVDIIDGWLYVTNVRNVFL